MPPLTKVLNGVTEARLILCDISSVAKVAGNPFRNGNVMYEVGIAHACRLPEEVLLFRSDRDDLLFDVTNIRVNQYDPDGHPDDARARVVQAVQGALNEIDLTKNRAVGKAAEGIDYFSFRLLVQASQAIGLPHPRPSD